MGDEKEGTVPNEPVVGQANQPVEQAVKEPEKTPFTMEDVRKMIAEEAEKIKIDGYKQSQRAIDKKDKEIAALKKQTTNAEANVDLGVLKDLALAIETGDEKAVAKAKEAISVAEKKAAEAKQFSYQQKIISENTAKFNDIIEKAGIDADDPRLVPYEVALNTAIKVDGDFTVPERVLGRLLKTVTPPVNKTENKVEKKTITLTEEELNQKIQTALDAEKVKQKTLKSDAGAVAGGNASGRKPTIEELRAASPSEFDKKVKSGEWKL
jgi:hypothetical protein